MAKTKRLPTEIAGMGTGHESYEAFYQVSSFQTAHVLHSHEFYEVFIHLGGGHHYLVNRETRELTPGTIMLIRPYEMHGHIYSGELRDYARAYAYFTPEYLAQLSRGLLSFEQMIDACTREGTAFFRLDEPQLSQAVALLRRVQENGRSGTAAARLMDMALLTQFLLLVLESIRPQQTVPGPQMDADILSIVSYISEHCFEPLTVEGIARHFNISRSHLSHRFIQCTGRGVYEYILYRRITRARQLIDRGEPLTEIAYACGFGDYSCFLRNFRKFVGCSPRAYRDRGARA